MNCSYINSLTQIARLIIKQGPLFALLAAALFGASTPLAKLFVGRIDAWLLASLLYLGSAVGLLLILSFKFILTFKFATLPKKDIPWLTLATLFGGVLGPVFLMKGLSLTSASNASLLLNLEGVFTALLAWIAFKEHYDRRIILGMAAIIAGGVVLTLPSKGLESGSTKGILLIIGACFCWGLDNNFTRKISASDSLVLTFLKSLIAGLTNLFISRFFTIDYPSISIIAEAMSLGFFGYGLSIVLFVLALRHLGASRTGAYFSTAPFIGSVLSLLLFPDSLSINILVAGLLMGIGVYLHLTEKHSHEHSHGDLIHTHDHYPDADHQHTHYH